MTITRIILSEIDPATAQREIEDFLIEHVTDAGARGGVVGLSGGIDSSTVAYVANSAFSRYSTENADATALGLLGVVMPSSANATEDEDDAREVAEQLGIELRIVEIQPLIDAFREKLPDTLDEKTRLGNLASEVRAVVLSRCAAARNALVLGTGNRDEDYCLGYFTKRGDGAVDLSPIGGLAKRHVRSLAAHMGVPERIRMKTPSAGLWRGQTDEGELGFTYEFAEKVLAGTDQGLGQQEVADALECAVSDVQKVLSVHKANSHKMHMPPVAPVSYV